MNRKFKVTVNFDLSNKVIAEELMIDFDIEKLDEEGNMIFTYHGNTRSSEKSVIKGMKDYLFGWWQFKKYYGKGVQIVNIKEVEI